MVRDKAGRCSFLFLSTPSARRATPSATASRPSASYFYPRPPRGGRRTAFPASSTIIKHFYPRPPRGGRPGIPTVNAFGLVISIHALLAEGDGPGHGKTVAGQQFLSTPSARRATLVFDFGKTTDDNFYPRPPRGGRPSYRVRTTADVLFLSTPSARRATSWTMPIKPCWGNFYPRPPRGGRP